jgi:hypothetical protein
MTARGLSGKLPADIVWANNGHSRHSKPKQEHHMKVVLPLSIAIMAIAASITPNLAIALGGTRPRFCATN